MGKSARSSTARGHQPMRRVLVRQQLGFTRRPRPHVVGLSCAICLGIRQCTAHQGRWSAEVTRRFRDAFRLLMHVDHFPHRHPMAGHIGFPPPHRISEADARKLFFQRLFFQVKAFRVETSRCRRFAWRISRAAGSSRSDRIGRWLAWPEGRLHCKHGQVPNRGSGVSGAAPGAGVPGGAGRGTGAH